MTYDACLHDRRYVGDDELKMNVRYESSQLRTQFKKMWQLYCPVGGCSASMGKSNQPFPHVRSLRKHLSSKHGAFLCMVCESSGKTFKCDLETFESKAALQRHRKTHPMCEFCNEHYLDDEELFAHLSEQHEVCNLCDEAHQYFESPATLAEHYSSAHHPCPRGCNAGLCAFRSKEGLQEHMLRAHASEMSRAERARLRQLDQIEFTFADSGAERVSAETADSRRSLGGGRGAFRGRLRGEPTNQVNVSSPSSFPPLRSSTTGNDNSSSGAGRGSSARVPSGRGAPPPSSASRAERQRQRLIAEREEREARNRAAAARDEQRRLKEQAKRDRAVEAEAGRQAAAAQSAAAARRAAPAATRVSREDYRARNKQMVARLKAALGGNTTKFKAFKLASKEYRNSDIDVDDYYGRFVSLFGTANANAVLPDLIATLPNPAKRQELANYHDSVLAASAATNQSTGSSSSWLARTAGGGGRSGGGRGRSAPSADSEFPALSSTASSSAAPSWPARNGGGWGSLAAGSGSGGNGRRSKVLLRYG